MRKVILFMIALSASGFYGCTSDHIEPEQPVGAVAKDRFMLSLDIVNPFVQTRSSVESLAGEEDVHTLHIFFFEYFSNASGNFIDAIYMEGTDQPFGKLGAIELQFPEGSSLNNETDYSMLVCANMGERYSGMTNEELLDYLRGKTEEEVSVDLRFGITGVQVSPSDAGYEFDNSQAISQDSLPMGGRSIKRARQESVTMELTRSVARLDIENNAQGYMLVSASVWNAYPYTSPWTNTLMDFSQNRTERFYGVSGLDNSSSGNLYVFENYENAPEDVDAKTTCLILGMEKGGNVYYYRVNINARNIGQYIKRNNIYKTIVKNVLSEGAANEREAYLDNRLLLDVDVNGWNIDDNGNIQYDGENILAGPTSLVSFKYEGGSNAYSIFTLGKYELSIVGAETILPEGITAKLNKGILTVSAKPSYTDNTGVITLKFGPLKTTINVEQNGSDARVLSLSATALPGFPAGNLTSQGPVSVTSSGTWIAKIYNNDGRFSFESNKLESMIGEGNDGETFMVSSMQTNEEITSHYAFVIVSLKSDPLVNRTLILTQYGAGGFTLIPMPEFGELEFDAFGMSVDLDRNLFYDMEVVCNDGAENIAWDARIVSGWEFELKKDFEQNHLRIVGAFNGGEEREAVVRIEHKDASESDPYIDIVVYQRAHTLTLNPGTKRAPVGGGITSAITVNASHTWTATISPTINAATFGNGRTTITGDKHSSFTIEFPKLDRTDQTPEAIVTVTVDGTNVQKTVTVKQDPMRRLVFETLRSYYSTISHYTSDYCTHRVSQIADNMRNTEIVGPVGKVYMPGDAYDFLSNTSTTWRYPQSNTDIYQINDIAPSATEKDKLMEWLGEKKNRILLVSGDLTQVDIVNSLEIGLTGVKAPTSYVSRSRTIYAGSEYMVENNKLYEYLLKTGPFTNGVELEKEQIQLRPLDGTSGALSAWSATFIPIIMHSSNTDLCVFGIDPTQRIIYLGDGEIFNNYGVCRVNFTDGETNAEFNMKFLNNIIAWMTNAAQYGEEFLKDFR